METVCKSCDSIVYLSYFETLHGCECSVCGGHIDPQETEPTEEETEDSW